MVRTVNEEIKLLNDFQIFIIKKLNELAENDVITISINQLDNKYLHPSYTTPTKANQLQLIKDVIKNEELCNDKTLIDTLKCKKFSCKKFDNSNEEETLIFYIESIIEMKLEMIQSSFIDHVILMLSRLS